MKYKSVVVDWIDSMGSSGWGKDPKEDYDLRCQTSGFLLRKTKDRIVVAQSISLQGSHADLIQIPLIAVKKVRYLKG